jgi:hypothetical protein
MSAGPTTLSNTLLGFGLFCIATAIVGGGLKAFGFDLGKFNSVPRQIMLGIFGIILCSAAGEQTIINLRTYIFPPGNIVETFGPAEIAPGQIKSFPLQEMQHYGNVEATISDIHSDPPGKEVRVYVCSSANPGKCKNEQLGIGRSISDLLPAGHNAINIVNFSTNPSVTVTFKVEHIQ